MICLPRENNFKRIKRLTLKKRYFNFEIPCGKEYIIYNFVYKILPSTLNITEY